MFAAVVFFGLAAVMGLTLATLRVVERRNPPDGLVFIHALLVLSGFGAIVFDLIVESHDTPAWYALYMLAFPAGAGLYLAHGHKKGELIPLDYVAMHVAFAVSAYIILVLLTLAFR